MTQEELLEVDQDYKKLLRSDYYAWCCEALAPYGQRPARHHKLLIDELKLVLNGKTRRLMIFMPPGSAKSTFASILFPPFWFANFPQSSVIAASHTAELAEKFGRRVRNTVEEYADDLGVTLRADSRAAGRWETEQGGEYYAAGVGGSITGRRADLGIIDDPIKGRADAESSTTREMIWDWYRSDFYTRLKPNARIILIMTRWHEADLAGKLIAAEESGGGDKWKMLNLPAFNGDGSELWPEEYSAEKLRQTRAVLGEYDWAALYEQRPRPLEGGYFSVSNFLVNDQPVPMPAICDSVFAVIDSATKTGKENDGTAVIYCARSKHIGYKLVVLDYDIIQIEGSMLEVWLPSVFKRLEELARQCKARFNSLGVWIEDKASGMILLQQAIRKNWNAHPIESKLTSVGKVERAINVSGYIFRGDVKFCAEAFNKVSIYKGVSRNHLVSQLLNFRVGTKDMGDDDLLDCFTYATAIALGNAEGF